MTTREPAEENYPGQVAMDNTEDTRQLFSQALIEHRLTDGHADGCQPGSSGQASQEGRSDS